MGKTIMWVDSALSNQASTDKVQILKYTPMTSQSSAEISSRKQFVMLKSSVERLLEIARADIDFSENCSSWPDPFVKAIDMLQQFILVNCTGTHSEQKDNVREKISINQNLVSLGFTALDPIKISSKSKQQQVNPKRSIPPPLPTKSSIPKPQPSTQSNLPVFNFPPMNPSNAQVSIKPIDPSMWSCERCTYENPTNLAICGMCDMKKPIPPPKEKIDSFLEKVFSNPTNQQKLIIDSLLTKLMPSPPPSPSPSPRKSEAADESTDEEEESTEESLRRKRKVYFDEEQNETKVIPADNKGRKVVKRNTVPSRIIIEEETDLNQFVVAE